MQNQMMFSSAALKQEHEKETKGEKKKFNKSNDNNVNVKAIIRLLL